MRESSLAVGDLALMPVEPAKPAAPYIGGKKRLAQRLCEMIEERPHATYAEAFVGMGGVFFRRKAKPRSEVINDWSADVHNFFRILQVHYVAFLEMMRFQISSRAEFERLSSVDPATLTDMQRAARFLFLQRAAFGGTVARRSFGVSPGNAARFDITKLQPMLEAIHDRLAPVTIERLPWAAFIRRWDRDGTLFYLDPPYHGSEGDYGAGMFGRDEFAEMAQLLAGIRGRFILSINDTPEIRELFGDFIIEGVGVRYSVGGNDKGREFPELIITNC